ncbi:hypothetical protein [Streptomyces sp. NPDC056304]|uniref:hypothetical protein n=1 Tax=Streptomyces sp. NPDC056304 TaxID=3345778 RepID=UPI0035DA9869
MPEHTVTLPHHGDQFVITDRPAPTLTDRYRRLPDGMNSAHLTVVRAHQIRTGDVVAAFFTDGPGIRRTEHVLGPFAAHPRAHGSCTASCEECEELNAHGASTDRYVCLDPADEREDCVVVFRNAPVAITPPTRQRSSRPWTPSRRSRTCSRSTTVKSAPTRHCPSPAPGAPGRPSASPGPRPSRSAPTSPPPTPADT